MKAILKTNFAFLLPYVLFLILGAGLILVNTKGETHLEFNRFHTGFFDHFFYYATYFGEGYIVTIIFILLLGLRYRYAILVGVANLFSAGVTQTLKHTLFSEVVRPKKFFEGLHDIYLVPGVDNHLYNSFPSGHTTCAFALYFSIGLIIDNKLAKFFMFIMALLVGYSRIYMSQHFFEDVYAGSVIGVLSTLLVFILLGRSKAAWLDRSLRKNS